MKITSVKASYPDYGSRPLAAWRKHMWQIVVRIESDTGLVGFGYGGGGRAAVEVVNRHFAELLQGKMVATSDDIAATWYHLYAESLPYGRAGVAVMALSGVDLALWDLLGKAENRPVHELLGGPSRDRVRAYATGPDTAWYGDLGFDAQKVSNRWTGSPADYEKTERQIAGIRKALGPGATIMIDTYMSWTAEVTLAMAVALAPHKVHFFEDILTPDLLDETAQVRQRIKPVLTAGGEHEFTHHGFRDVARSGALDVWQPDVTWCGGLTALKRIVDIAKVVGADVVPHRGGEVWGLHGIFGLECGEFAELVMGSRDDRRDETRDLWLGSPEPERGWMLPPGGPGFGVTLNDRFS